MSRTRRSRRKEECKVWFKEVKIAVSIIEPVIKIVFFGTLHK
jgi:hypothetical protein